LKWGFTSAAGTLRRMTHGAFLEMMGDTGLPDLIGGPSGDAVDGA
jgi:hypothetical protein